MKSPDYLTAVGIGVSDLARSADFYERVLGMNRPRPSTSITWMRSSWLTKGATPSC